MQSFSAQMAPWFAASGIVLCALTVVPGDLSFRQVAFASQTQAPSPQADASYFVHTIVAGDTLGSIAKQYGTTPEALLSANRKPRVPGHKTVTNRNVLTAGALLLIPTPSLSLPAPAEEPTLAHPPITPDSQVSPSVSQAPSVPSTDPTPPVSLDETVHAIADPTEGQTSSRLIRSRAGRLKTLPRWSRNKESNLSSFVRV